MSKICRTFAEKFTRIMKKQQYIQPQSFVELLSAQAKVMLLESGSGYEPGKSAPGRGIGAIGGE